MNKKIKILYQLNQLGYGGTEKAILSICENLDKEVFEPYLFFHTDYKKLRYYLRSSISFLKSHKESFERRYKIAFARLHEFENILRKENVFLGEWADFQKVIEKVEPQIIHFNRGDEKDFYTEKINQIPKEIHLVESSIFGKKANENYVNRIEKFFFISNDLLAKNNWQGNKGEVVFLVARLPRNNHNLRDTLEIPKDHFVMGRISRPNLDDGEFILKVFEKLQNEKTHLIFLAASENTEEKARNLSLKNVHFLPRTTSEIELSKFYNSIDLLLHYRKEGETFGMNIAEAMIHGKPVVSHKSFLDNAQAELLDEKDFGLVGFVAEENNLEQYINFVKDFQNNPELLKTAGENAQKKAQNLYSEKVVAEHISEIYKKLI